MTPTERQQFEYLWHETRKEMNYAASQGQIARAEEWLALLREIEDALGMRPRAED